MNRRNLMLALAGLTLAPAAWLGSRGARPALAGSADGEQVPSFAPIEKTEAEWKQLLSPAAYAVLREEGTERAGSSVLNNEKRPGTYICAGCFLPLFDASHKYDSGTGWPSFFTHVPGVMGTKRDWKLIYPRTEYHCIRCGGHQGHVFDDGPQPTGQRWCNNGVALLFVPEGVEMPALRT
jgi:peptide-methionine (R)-S-oxide reductase